ncbi:MAG: hypothetical protein WBZ36_01820 [Candidatus Nitrosopolaris sp.]
MSRGCGIDISCSGSTEPTNPTTPSGCGIDISCSGSTEPTNPTTPTGPVSTGGCDPTIATCLPETPTNPTTQPVTTLSGDLRNSISKMAEQPWSNSPEIKKALAENHASLLSFSEGPRLLSPTIDEYSITVEKLPPGKTPEQILSEWESSLNQAAKSSTFDLMNTFVRRDTSHPPAVGDIYDINFAGPDDGSVMMVEKTPSHFNFETLKTPWNGSPPVFGTRQFGFEENNDGSIKFYTRGLSKASILLNSLSGIEPIAQTESWTSFMKGFADQIDNEGGSAADFHFTVSHKF